VAAAPFSDGHERRGDTGAESDVYECVILLSILVVNAAMNHRAVFF